MRAIETFSRCCVLTLLATSLGAQTTADGIEAFHRGRYAQARQTLGEGGFRVSQRHRGANLSRPEPRRNRSMRRRRAPTWSSSSTNNPEASLRRLAGIALVQCGLSRNRLADVWPVLDQLQKSFPDDADVLYETARVHMKAWNDAVFQMYQKTPASFRVNQLSGEIFEIAGHATRRPPRSIARPFRRTPPR